MYASSYVWAKVLSRLEKQLTEVTVSAWFDDAEVIELRDDRLVVYSPSDFRQQIIRDRCAPYIEDILEELLQRRVKLAVWGDNELRQFRQEKRCTDSVFLNPQFTFDSFICGESNQIAVKIAKAASEHPGEDLYNPLFLYGPAGVGKTHLLYAIVNNLMQTAPGKKIVYIRADQFTNELIHAVRTGKTADFKQKYRQADALLIDDIQFISGKEATQEEFFHTFNELFEHKKQIVMTADQRPSDMATLENRLKSRFGSGILVGISPPDYETRRSIARIKAEAYSLSLSEEAIDYIAANLTDNVRQIESSLKKIRAFRDLAGMELTLENIQNTLADICSKETAMPITANLVIRNVCKYYGIDEDTLRGPQKSKGVAEPRQIAMYLVRKLVNLGFTDIGKLFRRDHGTVHHAVKKIEEALKLKNNALDGVIQDITANIRNTPC